ncbi:Hypothetical predicted protein [Pelobates cultripes]|uniref:Uncharacterized protein n=1 Tax=Pelobates cultripes TaxID=61616 RepID=A0AAD1S4I0_PELCU|nr:Hypothetical predicted protein [Pelobates cultripes]
MGRLDKLESSIITSKKKKYQRDTNDYATNNIRKKPRTNFQQNKSRSNVTNYKYETKNIIHYQTLERRSRYDNSAQEWTEVKRNHHKYKMRYRRENSPPPRLRREIETSNRFEPIRDLDNHRATPFLEKRWREPPKDF